MTLLFGQLLLLHRKTFLKEKLLVLSKPSVEMIINGHSYAVSALTDKDYDELTMFVRSKIVETNNKIADEMGLQGEERAVQRQEGIYAACKVRYADEIYYDIMGSAMGNYRLGWQMTDKKTPFKIFVEHCREDFQAALDSIKQAYDLVYPPVPEKVQGGNADAEGKSS